MRLCVAAFDQYCHCALITSFVALIQNAQFDDDDAARAANRFCLLDLGNDAHSVADFERALEFHIQFAERDDGAFQDAQLPDESNRKRQTQHAVRDAFAKHCRLAIFRIGVHGIRVPRQAREIYNIRFGDGAARRNDFLPDLEILKISAAWSVCHVMDQAAGSAAPNQSALWTAACG